MVKVMDSGLVQSHPDAEDNVRKLPVCHNFGLTHNYYIIYRIDGLLKLASSTV